MKKSYTILIPLIVIMVVGTIIINVFDSEDSTEYPETNIMQETHTIGTILPITGDLSSHGEESVAAARLAESHFNEFLANEGEPWRLNVIIEDTTTSPVLALEKLTSLHAKNIKTVVGPMTSAELRNLKGYADSNGLVIISPSSTAPELAIPDDSIFRFIADDTKQAPAIVAMLELDDIEVLIPVWRGDTWGDGLTKTTTEAFIAAGGKVDEGIRYSPDAIEFSTSVSLLDTKVVEYVEQYGADKVGIVVFSFAEILQIIQSASEHESLDDVRWYGGDTNTKDETMINDPIGSEFASAVQFTSTQGHHNESETYLMVQNKIKEDIGRIPNAYAYATYDAVWVAGQAIMSNIDDGADISETIPIIASKYVGAIGSTALNDAGDLAQADYAIWGIRDGEWKYVGTFSHADGTIILG